MNRTVALAQPDRARLVELVEAQREFRDLLLSDPHRPTYHFVNPEGRGMPFDPNGAIFWNSKYHLCYIYQGDNRIAEPPTRLRRSGTSTTGAMRQAWICFTGGFTSQH